MSPEHTETSEAWRLFVFNWAVIGLMAAALAIAMILTGFSFAPGGVLKPAVIIGGYLGVAYYNARRRNGRDPVVIFILGSTGQVLLIPILMTPMTYIAASANLPLQDAALAALDRGLGLDWHAYYDFISAHHWMVLSAVAAYSMIKWPIFGIPVVLGFARHYRRIQEFTLAFAIALVVTTVISALVPAAGIYDVQHFANPNVPFTSEAITDQLKDFPAVRDGSLRAMDLMSLTGIITFPSFHAASAVIFLWAFWAVWWMRPIAIVANIGMLFATPYIGSHYFIDVFAGIAIAIVSIAAACAASRWLTRPEARIAPAPFLSPVASEQGSARMA